MLEFSNSSDVDEKYINNFQENFKNTSESDSEDTLSSKKININESEINYLSMDIKKIMENDESVIVSFDYDSHKILSDNGIKHQISDDFLSTEDLWYIWRKSFSLFFS